MMQLPAYPLPPLIKRLQTAIAPHREVYLVGGTVRDMLRGRASHDVDLVVPRAGMAFARELARALGGAFYPLDTARDTGRIILEEDATRRYIDVAVYRGPTLEDDLRARDFTVNAMAVPLHRPTQLIDPTHGLRDLKAKVLRACSPHAFADDPLRVLRGVRLAVALQFRIEPQTRAQMQQAVPLLEDVSPERQRDELFRMLALPKPTAAIKTLDALGVLPYLLPELPRLHGIPQPPPHQADVWTHTLHTVEWLGRLLTALDPHYEQDHAADFALGFTMVRIGRYREHLAEHFRTHSHPERPLQSLLSLAALYHDVGKAETFTRLPDGRIHFHGHPEVGAQRVARRARDLHLSNAETQRLSTIVRHHMRPLLLTQTGQRPSRRAVYRFFRDTGDAGVDICLLSLADVLATYGHTLPHDFWQAHLETVRTLLEGWWEQRTAVVTPPPLLSGHDVMEQLGLRPGPLVGALLEALREAQAAGEIQTPNEALAFAQRWLAERET